MTQILQSKIIHSVSDKITLSDLDILLEYGNWLLNKKVYSTSEKNLIYLTLDSDFPQSKKWFKMFIINHYNFDYMEDLKIIVNYLSKIFYKKSISLYLKTLYSIKENKLLLSIYDIEEYLLNFVKSNKHKAIKLTNLNKNKKASIIQLIESN